TGADDVPQIPILVGKPCGIHADALADQRYAELQLPFIRRVLRITAAVEPEHGAQRGILKVEGQEVTTLWLAAQHHLVPFLGEADVLDALVVLIRPERVDVVVWPALPH